MYFFPCVLHTRWFIYPCNVFTSFRWTTITTISLLFTRFFIWSFHTIIIASFWISIYTECVNPEMKFDTKTIQDILSPTSSIAFHFFTTNMMYECHDYHHASPWACIQDYYQEKGCTCYHSDRQQKILWDMEKYSIS